LRFCNLHDSIQITPNDEDYDDKQINIRWEKHHIKKEDPLVEALTLD
jgi:hypothetical protein